MYSLDINLLKDRAGYKNDTRSRILKSRSSAGGLSRLYLGLLFGLLLPALAGGAWWSVNYQNSQLENQIALLDSELSRLGIQEQELKQIQAQTNKIQGENRALASVFNSVRPWSAMLQDLRDRIPQKVQIQSIKQTAQNSPPQAATSQKDKQQTPTNPVSAGGIEISGMASSFSDVNDFLLTLQQSPFFRPKDTKIVTAELVETPATFSQSGKVLVKPPEFVKYTIQSSLSDIPASELIGELESEGTLGLVTRIRTLQERGIIQR